MVNHRRRRSSGNYNQNDGVPGVVYILRNDAFKETWLKIGCSRHSGHVRARDMNRDASTGLPAHHVCVFEVKTLDCGRAEKNVHSALSQYRKGRQEFFEVDIETAKSAIVFCCEQIDKVINEARRSEEQALRMKSEEAALAAQRAEQQAIREQQEFASRARNRSKDSNESSAPYTPPPIDLTCPSCKTKLTAKLTTATIEAQRVRCGNCKLIFTASQGLDEPLFRKNKQADPVKAQSKSEEPAEGHSYEWLVRDDKNETGRSPVSEKYDNKKYDHSELNFTQKPLEIKKDKTYKLEGSDYIILIIVVYFVAILFVDFGPKSRQPRSAQQIAVPENPSRIDVHQPVAAPVAPQNSLAAASTNAQATVKPSAKSQHRKDVERNIDQDGVKAKQQAIAKAYADYPYLQSPDGAEAMRSIRSRADFLIEERHVSIADAYDQAVRGIAPRFEPLWYKDAPLSGVGAAQ